MSLRIRRVSKRRLCLGLGTVSTALAATLLSACSTPAIGPKLAAGPLRISLGARPYGAALSAAGILYVTQLDGGSITRFRMSDTAASGIVRVGFTPTDVAFDAAGANAFVTNQFDPSVGVVDVARGHQVGTVPSTSNTFRVLVSPNGQLAYATASGGQLLVINTATRALVATIPIPRTSNGLAFGAGDTLLYLTSMSGELATVNIKTNTLVRTTSIIGTLQDIAVSPDRKTLYVAHEDVGQIDVVNAATGVKSASFSVGSGGLDGGVFGLSVSPDGRSLWATLPSSGQVVVLDRVSGAVARTMTVGGIPRRIAFDRASGRTIVTNEAGWIDFLP